MKEGSLRLSIFAWISHLKGSRSCRDAHVVRTGLAVRSGKWCHIWDNRHGCWTCSFVGSYKSHDTILLYFSQPKKSNQQLEGRIHANLQWSLNVHNELALLNHHKHWNPIPTFIYLVPRTDEIPVIEIQTPFGSIKYIKWLKEGPNPQSTNVVKLK